MEHGQIFHVVLNTILEYKSKFQGSVLEFQDTVLPVLLDTDVTSNVLLDPILILHVQGMALGPLTLLVPGIWEKLKMAVMVALGLMEENVTEQLKLFWVCIYVLKFIYFEKNKFLENVQLHIKYRPCEQLYLIIWALKMMPPCLPTWTEVFRLFYNLLSTRGRSWLKNWSFARSGLSR